MGSADIEYRSTPYVAVSELQCYGSPAQSLAAPPLAPATSLYPTPGPFIIIKAKRGARTLFVIFGTRAGPWQDPSWTLDAKIYMFPCYFWDPSWTLAGPELDPGCKKSYLSLLLLGPELDPDRTRAGPWMQKIIFVLVTCGTRAGPWQDPSWTLDAKVLFFLTFVTWAGPWQDPSWTLDATNDTFPCYFCRVGRL